MTSLGISPWQTLFSLALNGINIFSILCLSQLKPLFLGFFWDFLCSRTICGIRSSNTLNSTSIWSSSRGLFSKAFEYRFVIWFRCLLWLNLGPLYYVYHVSNLFAHCTYLSEGLVGLKHARETFSPILNRFLATLFVYLGFNWFWKSWSNSDLIFRANLTSSGVMAGGTFLFGITI